MTSYGIGFKPEKGEKLLMLFVSINRISPHSFQSNASRKEVIPGKQMNKSETI